MDESFEIGDLPIGVSSVSATGLRYPIQNRADRFKKTKFQRDQKKNINNKTIYFKKHGRF